MTICDYCKKKVTEDGVVESFAAFHSWTEDPHPQAILEVDLGDMCSTCYSFFKDFFDPDIKRLFKEFLAR